MRYRKILTALWLICAIVFSITVVGRTLSKPDAKFNQWVIESVDDKIDTVMNLTAASSVASVAVSAIPDDTATPLANKLADFSSYFLIVLCVLYLEKYLVTLIGFGAFTFIIPIGLAMWLLSLFYDRRGLKKVAGGICIFGLAISLMIPFSVKASDMVYNTYQYSMQETIDSAGNFSIELEAGSEEENLSAPETGFINKMVTRVTSIGSAVIQKTREIITRFVEALAVMIVTSCLIPLIVIILYLWVIKSMLKVDISSFANKKWSFAKE